MSVHEPPHTGHILFFNFSALDIEIECFVLSSARLFLAFVKDSSSNLINFIKRIESISFTSSFPSSSIFLISHSRLRDFSFISLSRFSLCSSNDLILFSDSSFLLANSFSIFSFSVLKLNDFNSSIFDFFESDETLIELISDSSLFFLSFKSFN